MQILHMAFTTRVLGVGLTTDRLKSAMKTLTTLLLETLTTLFLENLKTLVCEKM